MGNKIVLQEVVDVQDRLKTSVTDLEQSLQALINKVDGITQMNSFDGRAAKNIKVYLENGHKDVSSKYIEVANLLQEQFQKVVEEFQGEVDSNISTIIAQGHLEDLSRKIALYKIEFDRCNKAAKSTIDSISDIIAIPYPSAANFAEGVAESIKKIDETIVKFEMFSSKDNDLQSFEKDMKVIEKKVKEMEAVENSISTMIAENGPVGGVLALMGKWTSLTNKGTKTGKLFLSSLIRFYFMRKNYNFEAFFDVDASKGKGAYTLSTLKREDLIAVAKILQMDKNDDALFQFVKNKFKLPDLKITKSEIKKARKTILKLPEFQGYQKFQVDKNQHGRMVAVKNKAWDSFKEAYKEGVKEVNLVNPKEWKAMFKDLGKVGTTIKGLGVAGSALSIGNNVVAAQKDGWQLHDIADITTDSAVDIGATAGAAATGAVVGSFFLPPVGTVVGAGVGIATGFVLNHKWGFLGKESVVGHAKTAVKGVTKKIGSLFW